MANTTYNLLDDDGFLYAVQYIFTKLKNSPLNVNSTYSISLDETNEWIVLTDDQGQTSHVSYSDFGDANVIETVKVNGSALTPDANKAVNIPAATDSATGVMTSTDHTKLTGIASGAQVNVLEGIQIGGTDVAVSNKKSNIPLASSSANGAMSSTDKSKLDGVASGAQVNVLEGVQIAGTDLPVSGKKVNIPDAGATTKGVITTNAINSLIQAAISVITGVSFVKVASYSALPTNYSSSATYAVNDYCLHDGYVYKCNTAISVAEAWNAAHWTMVSNVFGTFFLVPNSGTTPNIYDEYIYTVVDATTTPATYGYEKIGTTAVDLSGYVQYTDISLMTNQQIADAVDDAYDAVFNPTP